MHVKSINVVKEFEFCTIGVIIHLVSQIKIHLLHQKKILRMFLWKQKNKKLKKKSIDSSIMIFMSHQ